MEGIAPPLPYESRKQAGATTFGDILSAGTARMVAVGFAAPAIGLLPAAWSFTAVIAVISLGATSGLLKLRHATAGG
jgi:hypothetical protein